MHASYLYCSILNAYDGCYVSKNQVPRDVSRLSRVVGRAGFWSQISKPYDVKDYVNYGTPEKQGLMNITVLALF